jgi:hypothetical protein
MSRTNRSDFSENELFLKEIDLVIFVRYQARGSGSKVLKLPRKCSCNGLDLIDLCLWKGPLKKAPRKPILVNDHHRCRRKAFST